MFQIRGLVRVVMKPMLSVMPLIGGVQIFYLNNPSINFNLVGVADVLDLPGFRYEFLIKSFHSLDKTEQSALLCRDVW